MTSSASSGEKYKMKIYALRALTKASATEEKETVFLCEEHGTTSVRNMAFTRGGASQGDPLYVVQDITSMSYMVTCLPVCYYN